jgi:hypothetical protein
MIIGDKMKEMTKLEALCDRVIMELFEVKMHICNERHFEGGIGLGILINSLKKVFMLFNPDIR